MAEQPRHQNMRALVIGGCKLFFPRHAAAWADATADGLDWRGCFAASSSSIKTVSFGIAASSATRACLRIVLSHPRSNNSPKANAQKVSQNNVEIT